MFIVKFYCIYVVRAEGQQKWYCGLGDDMSVVTRSACAAAGKSVLRRAGERISVSPYRK